MTNNALNLIGIGLLLLAASACGYCGYTVADSTKHLYDDHVLVDEIRRVNQQQLIDSAKQLQQTQPK